MPDTGEFIVPDALMADVKIHNCELSTRVDELESTFERLTVLTHNRYHDDGCGRTWRECVMLSCRQAVQVLGERTTGDTSQASVAGRGRKPLPTHA